MLVDIQCSHTECATQQDLQGSPNFSLVIDMDKASEQGFIGQSQAQKIQNIFGLRIS